MKKYTLLLLFVSLATIHSEAHVSLLSPNGGENYNSGETVTIEWQVIIPHNSLNWDLYFSGDGGNTWDIIQIDIPIATLSLDWIVPETQTNQARIKIVQDNVDSDYDGISDDFTISGGSITDISTQFEGFKTNIYPNPLVDFSTLEFDNPNHNNFTLTLYSTQGRIVRTIPYITMNRVIIRKENLTTGLYFFQLNIDRDVYATGRLVIE